MKKSLLLFLLLLFVSTFAQYRFNPHGLGTEDQEREKIISFHSIIDVNKNSGIIVTEKIKVYSTGNEIKRGIFRNLPLSRNLNNKKQKVSYTIISITKDGKKETYHTKKNGDNFEIYVGKKNIILDTGSYDYEIKYETKNQIT